MIRYKYLSKFGPEIIVSINTVDGPKESIVSKYQLWDDTGMTVRYMYPVEDGNWYVALHRELSDGAWGAVVPASEIIPEKERFYAKHFE